MEKPITAAPERPVVGGLGSTGFRRVRANEGVEASRALDVARPVRPAERSPVPEVVPRERSEGLNRFLNASIALVGLLVASPLLLVIAILIRLTSRGPILYAQTRVGLDRRWRTTLAMHERRLEDLGGQVFTIYKFRTMRVDAERHVGVVWAQENDPRVTPLGRYLRILRLDEIPQLWNVVRGDMNLVGPRPERPSIVARLREDIPEYQFRQRVKPGITGLAQINQNYDASLDDVRSKVKWDLAYIGKQSLLLDIRILITTVPAVLLKYRGW
jgi:lipopolysaccharide/colanic/teichoic acid biosynthesis glycosyltransferase